MLFCLCALSSYMILKWTQASNFNRKSIHFKLLPCCTGVSANKIKKFNATMLQNQLQPCCAENIIQILQKVSATMQ